MIKDTDDQPDKETHKDKSWEHERLSLGSWGVSSNQYMAVFTNPEALWIGGFPPPFLGPHQQHMELPKLGVESEL